VAADGTDSERQVSGLQIVMLALSVYVLGALFVQTAFKLPAELAHLLQTIDNLICVLFIWDFFFGLYRAKRRWHFLKWHWIDLLSSIPTLEVFRWGRAVQVVRVMRVLRAVRSMKVIIGMIFLNKIKGAVVSLFLLAVLLVVFSAIGVMIYEVGPGANIRNGNDALWWAVTTITSVGYGDKYPVTTAGRIIGTVLMLGGIALAGSFAACVTSVLLESERQKSAQIDTLIVEVRLLREKVEALEQQGEPPGQLSSQRRSQE